MKVEIKKMELRNFKGIKELTLELTHSNTIAGANATGKTSVFDAFTWCLFGKDHADRTDTGRGSFAVKTLDREGKAIEKLEHEVTLTLDIDGRETRLTRRLSENWVKKTKAKEPVFEGNTTTYIWNDVEVKAGEYNRRIETEIAPLGIFKMMTNPHHFSSLAWQDQLAELARLVGDVSLEDVAEQDVRYKGILAKMSPNDTLAIMRESNRQSRTRLKKRLDEIQPLIAGIKEGTPQAPDYAALEAERIEKKTELDGMLAAQNSISERENQRFETLKQLEQTKAGYRLEQQQIETKKLQANNNLIATQRQILAAQQEKVNAARDAIKQAEQRIAMRERDRETGGEIAQSLNAHQQAREQLLKEWQEENERTFVATENDMCPFTNLRCNDPTRLGMIMDDTNRARQEFNAAKIRRLDSIEARGKAEKEAIQRLTAQIQQMAEENAKADESDRRLIEEKQAEVYEAENAQKLSSIRISEPATQLTPEQKKAIPEWVELEGKIAETDRAIAKLQQLYAEVDNIDMGESTTTSKIKDLQQRLEEIAAELGKKAIIETNEKRIAQLEDEEMAITQQLADLEMDDEAMRDLEEAQIREIGERANKLCRFVKFNTCDHQINGEPVRTCYATVDGVRYGDLNSAMQTNAGLDIINAMAKVNGISLPIFIDNAEGVNTLEPTEAQTIRLAVSKDKQLTIKNS